MTSFVGEPLNIAFEEEDTQSVQSASEVIFTLQKFMDHFVNNAEYLSFHMLIFLEIEEPYRGQLLDWAKLCK